MLDNVGDGKELQALSGNEINLGHDPDNESFVYEQVYINDVSELNGKSLVIANFNNHPAVVTNEIFGTGLIGNKDISCQSDNMIISSDMFTKWTFQQVDGNKFYLYSYIDDEIKYMSISGIDGNGNVSLFDVPVELYISQHEAYPGKIKISISDDKGMALNWYGANGLDNKFSGWNDSNETDPNDFQTVLEVKNTDNNYDYKWFSQNANDNLEICFQKDMALADDEALYIVVRTAPSYKPVKDEDSGRYRNGVESKQDGSSTSNWVHANTAEYILKTASAVFKEGMKAYRFDGTKWIDNDGDASRLKYWRQELITEPGTYAEWLININWDGSMEGLAEVSDQLPDNVTPVYLCPFWIPIETTTYPTIPELESDDNWTRMQTSEIPFYYNPNTNELRWRVDGLQKETESLKVNKKTVNLQLICKINAPDILLSGEPKNVDNTVTVTNNGIVSKNTGTVTISPECSLTKLYKGNVNASGKTSDRKLHFEITVNPCKEILGNNNVLPPLIDEFKNLIIIESSLEIKSEDGKKISGYTYNIENNRMTINKLPDNQKIIITYDARTIDAPDKDNDIIVSNKAYWEGHEQPQAPQVDSLVVNHSMGGDVTLTGNPKISVIKVDSENSAKHLEGAEFELHTSNGDLIETGTTDNNGKLIFGNNTTLSYDTVYYISEKTAPDGYEKSNEKYYFVVLKDREVAEFGDIAGIDIWDSNILGNEYERTIRNSKEKIRVDKSFTDEKIGNFVPVSGKFTFGIFDKNPVNHPEAKPLQILEIEYVNSTPQYKLDNIPKTAPEFTIAEPEQSYYVFELDESQKPIFNDGYLSTKDNLFKVKYTSQLSDCNMVTISRNTISIENQVTYFTMPDTGGIGLKNYYLIAGLFAVTAILIFLKIKRDSLKNF